MNKRGSLSLFVAYTLPAVLLAGVFAVDAARIWLVKARLQAAVDAAVLAAARDMSGAKRDANGKAVMAASNVGGLPPVAGQGSTWVNPTIEAVAGNPNQIKGSAEARMTSLLGGLGGLSIGGLNVAMPSLQVTLKAEAVAERANTGVELALVFDTTLSMAQWTDGKQNIVHAQEAAKSMLGILYGDVDANKDGKADNPKKWLEGMYFSIVPFNIAINIGADNTHMHDETALNYLDATNTRTFRWSGCVEARQGTYHLTDDGPLVSKFRRYYWSSDYNLLNTNSRSVGSTSKRACTTYQDYSATGTLAAHNGVCMGHNDWTAPLSLQATNNFLVDANEYVRTKLTGVAQRFSFGPNMMCPNTAVLPLTRDRATVEAKIDELSNLPAAFGTIIPTGLQGAWYTLSPNFRRSTGGWISREPPVDPKDPAVPPLPLDYDRMDVTKVVVLLSDGDNNWPNARNITSGMGLTTSGDRSRVVLPENTRTELFYSGYGLLSTENRLGVSKPATVASGTLNGSTLDNDYSDVRDGTPGSGGVDAKLNEATSALCTAMKKKGIVIFTVGFGIGADTVRYDGRTYTTDAKNHRDLMRSCATSPAHFLEAPTADKIKDAFETIARQLATLRLRQ